MKKSMALRVISCAVMLALVAAVGVVAVAGCDPTGVSQVVEQGKKLEQQALDAATTANLRMIDAAIQVYYAENEKWPTDINQLAQSFGGKVPSDPSGKTYYIQMVNGEAKAAVK
ncbi:MAG: hypothetical protein ACYC99_15325 [Candidatus Geothermincolia bacterium]